MSNSYQVDADALFSDDEDAVPSPSPKRARVLPTAPKAPSLGPLKLPSYGTASLSRSPNSSTNPSTSSYSSYSSHASRNNTNPYAHLQNSYPRPNNSYAPRPSFARGSAIRPATNPYNRINQPPRAYSAPLNRATDHPRGPMGRGRAATLPAHVTRHHQPDLDLEHATAEEKSIAAKASILPEGDRARFIEQEMNKRQPSANTPSPSTARKRPGRRRRPDQQSAQKVLANLKNSRKGTFKGLNSLLQAAHNSGKNLIQLEGSKHRVHRPEKVHAVYAEATMTKEMIEREERERREKEREEEEQRERIHLHFRQMRQRERDERQWNASKWRRVETVAAGMRDAYKLAKVEMSLFAEEQFVKRRTMQYWGLTLLPVEEDEKVTEMMTIHVEEI